MPFIAKFAAHKLAGLYYMIKVIYKGIFNRNIILVAAIIIGMFLGDGAHFLKNFNMYILAMVMSFSMTGISSKGIFPLSKTLKTMGTSILLGYFIFSSVLILLSYIFIDNQYLFYGMVIIAASPPGVAVIPFTHMLKGDMNYTMIGTLGTYLSAIVIAPLIIYLFSGSSELGPMQLVMVMVKIIIVPFIISRLLQNKYLLPAVEKVRGKLVDYGFALIVYTAVGLNREVFFDNFEVLGILSLIFILAMFGLGALHEKLAPKLGIDKKVQVSQNLLLTVKSSGFTASVSLAIFGKEAAVPSAILAVLVLVYLLYLSFRNQLKNFNIENYFSRNRRITRNSRNWV